MKLRSNSGLLGSEESGTFDQDADFAMNLS